MAKQTQAQLIAAMQALLEQALAAQTADGPAATVPPPVNGKDFLKGRKRAAAPAPKAPEPKEAAGIRSYTCTGHTVSKYGHPYVNFQTTTKNGGQLDRQVPADLAAQIRTGVFDAQIKAALDEYAAE